MNRLELMGVAVSLTVSNLIFQAFTHHDYQVAFERSFFEGTAILLVGILSAIKARAERVK